MKIGITCYPTFGGSGVVATELGLELARRGDDVHFISYDVPSRLNGSPSASTSMRSRRRMGRYPLFDHFPYTLALATKMAEVAVREGSTSCTSTTPSRTPSARTWRARCSGEGSSGSSRRCTARTSRSSAASRASADHEVLDRELDGVTAVSMAARRDLSALRLRRRSKSSRTSSNRADYRPAEPARASLLAPRGQKAAHVTSRTSVR